MAETNYEDRKDLDFITDFLARNPYTTPDGRVLTGEAGALEFIELFFPDEAGKFKAE
jgi:hypothetical protein